MAATAQNAPRSAIPWLSQVLVEPLKPAETPTGTTRVEPVDVTSISNTARARIGILAPDQTGFDQAFWQQTSQAKAISLIASTPYSGPPTARRLFKSLLITRLSPPIGASEAFEIARIDRLLALGALDEADVLLQDAKPDTPRLFRRWFDVNLLTHRVDRPCADLAQSPALAPHRAVDVFCLAVNEDWEAASLALNLGETLGEISASDALLLDFFLDPALIEEIDPPVPSATMTAFEFFIRDSVGLKRTEDRPPLAFYHADLAEFIPARFRMEAAERLVQAGALSTPLLFDAYRQEDPAVSGGVWERADAVQEMDAAVIGEDIAKALVRIDREFDAIGLRHAIAEEFAGRLSQLVPDDIPPQTHAIIAQLLLLGGRADAAQAWVSDTSSGQLRDALSIATGGSGPSPIARAFEAQPSPADTADVAPFFDAITQLSRGTNGDDAPAGLATLRNWGFDTQARQIAVELLLDPNGSNG
jgi:hypothetical protein